MSNGSLNILSKVDKSLVGNPNNPTVSKVSRYDWTTGGSEGDFMMIGKKLLNIDGRYQRDQVSERKVLDIAGKWDWLLLGTLSVIEREDGTFWVFDGGHRTRASFYREDVTFLPCMVHKISGVNEEAKAFVARNTMTSKVSAVDRFRASVCAEEPVSQVTNTILQDFGLTAVSGGATGRSGYISCIGTLQKCVEVNATDARKVLAFCVKLSDDSPVSGRLLNGMFTLHQHFKPRFDVINRYGEKMERHSQREIEVKMNQFMTECGKGGNVIFAKAILELINYKTRNRIEW